ncbi:hypothetical protein BJN34_01530 [Cupriavidus necator]|uniref:DUF6471 domain-containing protein n=1 Tax=Cupriavidus necator TaxID=106590 RepID=A0A1U9UJW2_CUPNE|nr:DUF6471 domain-containing protein [Cupriavidus necator]AQV92571.1 hypothetical protein BJN34_01530 [Cupriavidus necator]
MSPTSPLRWEFYFFKSSLTTKIAVSHVDTAWTRLASRTARGLLARKGFNYDALAASLTGMGVQESFRGAESKIQRGAYRFTFFLQVLQAVDAEYPQQWTTFVESRESWEVIATHIFLEELKNSGLDYKKLARRFAKCGIASDPNVLESQISSGDFQFTLILQLSLVAPIAGIERFVDRRDVERTPSESGDAPRR